MRELPCGGEAWLEKAYAEVRTKLARGKLVDGEKTGRLIGLVLDVQEGDGAAERSRAHVAVLTALLEGVGAVINGALGDARRRLDEVGQSETVSMDLRWVAAIWQANAHMREATFGPALKAARLGLEFAQSLDEQARATTLCKLSDLYFAAGHDERAMGYLAEAQEAFINVDDLVGRAKAHLSMAQIYCRQDNCEAARQEAENARVARPEWVEPTLFIAWQELANGMSEEALATVAPLEGKPEATRELSRLRQIALRLADDEVEIEDVKALVRLRALPPGEKVNEELAVLAKRAPDLPHVRELLAWNLLKVGHAERAQELFIELQDETLPSEVKTSVMLGLGVAASRLHDNQAPGARMFAAKAAGFAMMERIGLEAGAPRGETDVEGDAEPWPESEEEAEAEPWPEPEEEAEAESAAEAESEPAAEAESEPAAEAAVEAAAEEKAQAFVEPPEDEGGSGHEELHDGADAGDDVGAPAEEEVIDEESLLSEMEADAEAAGVQESVALTEEAEEELQAQEALDSLTAFIADAEEVEAEAEAEAEQEQEQEEEELDELDIDIDFDESNSIPAQGMGGLSAGFAFDGDLEHFSVADLIDFLYRSRRSGTLVVTGDSGIGAVHIRDGKITGATSPHCTNIGDILLEQEVITRDQLSEVAEVQEEASRRRPMGKLLVERFGIDDAKVQKALRDQVRLALLEMLEWVRGRFAFEPERPGSYSSDEGLGVEIDALAILLDASRIRDERNRE